MSRRRGRLAATALCKLLAAASVWVASGAQAQTPACDQLKASLTARIKPGPTGFTLETVRADAPVPPGAKAIGTCEGNVYKILMRRGGNASNAQGAASAVPGLASAVAAKPPVVEAPPAPAPRPAELATKPAAASPPDVAPRASEPAAPAFRGPLPEPEKVALNDPAPAPPVQAPRVAEPSASGSRTQRVGAFVGRNWLWILPLILLPLGAWAWMWIAHRRAYDEAGLPRGPRL